VDGNQTNVEHQIKLINKELSVGVFSNNILIEIFLIKIQFQRVKQDHGELDHNHCFDT
jgi:hypothetical protein